jgi:prepilin-type N-terminal cleavage/methylation domain-containing protein
MNSGIQSRLGRRGGAFTLIELIIVLALLSSVLALSAPRLAKFFQGRTLVSETKRFVALTRYAQSMAVSEGIPIVLWVDVPSGEYGLEPEAGFALTETLSPRLAEDRVYAVAEGLEIEIEQPGLTRRELPRILFLPEGTIGQESIETLMFEDKTGERRWVALSRNRLRYELHNQTTILERQPR